MNNIPFKSQKVLKATAWTNIVAQVLFPVATVFTPLPAGAGQHNPPSPSWTSEALKNAHTQPYIIKQGESVGDIASRAGLTIEQLKKVNQFRTFSKPFNKLSAGDEIDIPVFVETKADSAAEPDHSSAQKVASATTSAAGMLSSGDAARAATDRARSYASERLNEEITDWLSSAGTARTKLSVDNKGRLNGSELDVLVPFRDTPDAFLFTQAGIRHIDDRTTANLGLGQRHFVDNKWMFGYNAFLDYDLTRDHSRLGLGLEYGRDYLKVGTNGYFRLSNWRGSPDLKDYDERPANGFDIRSEAWLPQYPQLGASLAYEQYFGNEVGVISKDVRGKNPAAFSAGLTYTPIPLVSLGLERKQDTNGDGNTLLNLGLNYEMGAPWSKQIDPDAVRDMRTLTGNRYDLVERNNQIVLEYRKQEVIRLKLPSLVTGLSGETRPLDIGINAKYGLDYVEWDDASLVQAGGKVQGQKGQYSVVLPPYTPSGENSWTISAVAYDKKGNVSKRKETQVSVTSAGISATKSTFSSSEAALPADGESTSDLILELRDENNNPVTGLSDKVVLNIAMQAGDGSEPTLSAVQETSAGTYKSVMTAGTRKGVVTLTPEVSGTALTGTTLELLSPAAPAASNLQIKGLLETGQALSATYTFTQPDSATGQSRNSFVPADSSKYAWGPKGTTAQSVLNGNKISVSGQIPSYTLSTTDTGRIIELSVLPENSLGIDGQILTVDTSMSADAGNSTAGGDGSGAVISTSARPAISGLTLKGNLQVNKKLSASYKFEPQNGDIQDKSTYAWAAKGEAAALASASAGSVETSGTVPDYTVSAQDAGKVLEVAVQPRNGKNVTGTVVTLATDAENSDGNNTSGGGEGGIIIDPTGLPSVSNLKFRGSLVSGTALTASYDFDAGVGVPGDKSQFAWGEKGTTAALVSQGSTVSGSGVVPSRQLVASDVGKILELSLLARNSADVTGNTETLTTADKDNGINGNDSGTIIDAALAPVVENLSLSGTLAAGSALKGTYTFNPNNGDRRDNSVYLWGIKGQTASAVSSSGSTVSTSGVIPDEIIGPQHVGKILEVSVLPKNGLDVKGTVVSMATDVSGGNNFNGGNNGQIVDPAGAPALSNLVLSGKLITGSKLQASYTFDPQTGDPSDKSEYLWGEKGQTAGTVAGQGQTVSVPGTVGEIILDNSYIGKIIEVSVLAKNGLGVTGNTETIASDAQAPANSTTDGGTDGKIVDALAAPSVTNLAIQGTLSVGGALSFTYTFNPNNGHLGDASYFKWGQQNTTASVVTSQGTSVSAPNVVRDYTIVQADTGKVLEVSVLPQNGIGVTGTVVTADTTSAGNTISSGNNGAVVDPNGVPSVSNLKILTGGLGVGETMSASYTFNPGTGPVTDKSLYAWGIRGTTSATVLTSGAEVTVSGSVPAYTITQNDQGEVFEVSVLPRNENAKLGTTITTVTGDEIGWYLETIDPADAGYLQLQNSVGAKWMWLPFKASGPYVFTNKQGFTSTTKTGVVRLAVDDNIYYLNINGKMYDTSGCAALTLCTIDIDNLETTKGNYIKANVFNQSGTTGVLALAVNDANGNMVFSTNSPSQWTYYMSSLNRSK